MRHVLTAEHCFLASNDIVLLRNGTIYLGLTYWPNIGGGVPPAQEIPFDPMDMILLSLNQGGPSQAVFPGMIDVILVKLRVKFCYRSLFLRKEQK